MARVIGITGLMGSGKSTLTQLFTSHGWLDIDVDQVGKDLLTKPQTIKDLLGIFGPTILSPKGEIVPKKLGSLVFSSPKELRKLNQYMHPKMKTLIQEKITQTPDSCFVIQAALLFQMELASLCSFVIALRAPNLLLQQRIREKNSYLTPLMIERLLKKQKKDNGFFKNSDILIENSQTTKELEKKFNRFYSQFKECEYESR